MSTTLKVWAAMVVITVVIAWATGCSPANKQALRESAKRCTNAALTPPDAGE